MLDLFLKLIDRLIELTKAHNEEEEKRLRIVSAVYADLERIHADYLGILERLSVRLETHDNLVEIMNQLRTERVAFEGSRRRIIELVRELKKEKGFQRFRDFLEQVGGYFFVAHLERWGDTMTSLLLRQAKEISEQQIREMYGDRGCALLKQAVDRTADTIRESWRRISEEHAKLVTASMRGF